MRIGIDARFITRYPRRGIGSYSLYLVIELVRLSPENHFYLYISDADEEQDLPKANNVSIRRISFPSYPLWEQVALPIYAVRDRLDLLHCLGNTAPLLMHSSIKLILTLHDVMFLQSGSTVPKPTNSYQAVGRLYRRFVAPRAALLADEVITVSNFSRSDILNMIFKLDPKHVHVTYQSCDHTFKEEASPTFMKNSCKVIEQPYILALGADDPRKNSLRLVKSYLNIIKKYKIDYNLVICGYANWEQSEAYRTIKNACALDRVKFYSFITKNSLVDLYRNATMFVYPSLYEGFGIPLLEAFSCGCPVIASNVTSIPEVGVEAVLYVNPLSEDDIGEAIYRLIQDDELRQSLIQRGYVRALEFNWEETAKKTLMIYKKSSHIF